MSVTLGTPTTILSAASGTTITTTAYDVPVGSTMLLLRISWRATSTAVASPSFTYKSVSMTLVSGTLINNGVYSSGIYYLINPATGSNNVAGSWTNAASWVCDFVNVNGCSSVPLGTGASGSSANATVGVSSAIGHLVLDVICLPSGLTGTLATSGASSDYNGVGSGTYSTRGQGSHVAGATLITASWTFTSNPWVISACDLVPDSNGFLAIL